MPVGPRSRWVRTVPGWPQRAAEPEHQLPESEPHLRDPEPTAVPEHQRAAELERPEPVPKPHPPEPEQAQAAVPVQAPEPRLPEPVPELEPQQAAVPARRERPWVTAPDHRRPVMPDRQQAGAPDRRRGWCCAGRTGSSTRPRCPGR
jgi:hypothetical protein